MSKEIEMTSRKLLIRKMTFRFSGKRDGCDVYKLSNSH